MAQRLGNVAVGGIVKLKEDGSPKNYIVVHQGLPGAMYDASCNGTWLLRKEAVHMMPYNYSRSNVYELSDSRDWLENDMFNSFQNHIQPLIKQIKIPYVTRDYKNQTGANGLSSRVFSLSDLEVGFEFDNPDIGKNMVGTGAKLSYFDAGVGVEAKKKRVCKYDGLNKGWLLRSPVKIDSMACGVTDSGAAERISYDWDRGVRPAMILPQNLTVDDNGNITANTYPDPPTSITVPSEAIPTGSTIAISWSAVTGATYKLQRSADGGSWADLYTGGNNSYSDTAGNWNKVKYRVASVKSGITSGYTESLEVQILPYTVDKITAPSQVMAGQQIPVSWSSVAAANTYVLERKSRAADWAQIYSGADTQFTDTPEGGWTSVQYRVKAGKDGTFGGYTTSPEIPVISASALVISGQDGDLGTLTNDVPYTVSSDTGNPITVERFVNGSLVARVTVESGFAYSIPVMELPTGAGTIKLVCSVTPSSGGPVTATRIWGYTKTVVQFPGEGGPAVLQQEGKKVLPITLAECIKVPVNWGGSLDKSLELLLPLLNTAVMATGSYTGTGTFGQDNPNELSFTFDPEIVIVSGASGSITISNKEPSGGQSDGYIQNQKATWYSTSAAKQLNVQREQYSYWAVGKAVQT